MAEETPAGSRPAGRRRFIPVPIETTAESFRQGRKNDMRLPNTPGTSQLPGHSVGPTGELTPSPSPLSASPPPPPVSPPPTSARLWTSKKRGTRHAPRKEKRHFAPQLIDFSRRSRRSGDVGPATKPTDKTDITPHQNHIYAPKHRKKHRKVQSLARRESCDEETAGHVFEMLAREAEARMLEDAALAAYPNSRARVGGAEHFVLREGSDDDVYASTGPATPAVAATAPVSEASAAEAGAATTAAPAAPYRRSTQRIAHRSRRDSSVEDVGWALRELQRHHEKLAKARAEKTAAEAAAAVAAEVRDLVGNATMDGAADLTGAPATGKAKVGDTPPVRSATDSATTPARLPRTAVDRVSTFDLDHMTFESPPNDGMFFTRERRFTEDGAISGSFGDSGMPYIPEEAEGYQGIPAFALRLRQAEDRETGARDSSDEDDVYIQATAAANAEKKKVGGLEAAEAAAAAAATAGGTPGGLAGESSGFRGRNAYAGYRNRDIFASEREVERLRKKAPPLLGAHLEFRMCESPQSTKLETDFMWHADDVAAAAAAGAATASRAASAAASRGVTAMSVKTNAALSERNRDPTGVHGLWQGYCYTSTRDQLAVPTMTSTQPALLETPLPLGSPDKDLFAQAFGHQHQHQHGLVAEPASTIDGSDGESTPPRPVVPKVVSSAGLWQPASSAPGPASSRLAKRNTRGMGTGAAAAAAEAAAGPATGLHPLQRAVSISVSVADDGDDVKDDKDGNASAAAAAAATPPSIADPAAAAAAREAKIAAEFTDRFVTQVFNYLSLGYPAMARDYDEELAKISRVPIAELQADDDAVEGSARGHLSLGDGLFESDDDGDLAGTATMSHSHADCPRWRALKLYIFEWARQHPDLDGAAQPWGVRERRGSWGV